jgi:hypothetical protein
VERHRRAREWNIKAEKGEEKGEINSRGVALGGLKRGEKVHRQR